MRTGIPRIGGLEAFGKAKLRINPPSWSNGMGFPLSGRFDEQKTLLKYIPSMMIPSTIRYTTATPEGRLTLPARGRPRQGEPALAAMTGTLALTNIKRP